MQILSGLAEGQVLQRLGSRLGAIAELSGSTTFSGSIFAAIFQERKAIDGWARQAVGQAARGKFSALLANISAGGPYRLELTSDDGTVLATVKEFFVGDVWILAGQSNMEGCGNRSGAAKPHPLIRAFSMRREWCLAEDPLHLRMESPDICHNGGIQCSPKEGARMRKTNPKGTGVGIFFGQEMLKRSGVPQGLICTSHGGTSMTQWSPANKAKGGESLYASMLASWKATGQPVAGLLWYQGESDANTVDAPLYTQRMKALVAASRRDLRQPVLPWIIVQLGRHFTQWNHEQVLSWNSIQEQQRLLPQRIKHLDVVPAVDLSLDDPIHIGATAFPILANRFARTADLMIYGSHREERVPQLAKIVPGPRINGSQTIDIHFEEITGKLTSDGEPQGFSLLNTEGRDLNLIFKTTLHGNVARLHFNALSLVGLQVSYGHGLRPHCTIHDERGISIPVFGPLTVGKPVANLPFITTWQVSKVLTEATPLKNLTFAEIQKHPRKKKTYGVDGFVNEVEQWRGKAGQCYFQTQIDLPEPMHLDFLIGYDGPFRLWLDGKPFFANLDGTNPAWADESRKGTKLTAGKHDITVAMDLNNGAAWGFFLRAERKDVSLAKIKAGQYLKPTYSR